MSKTSYDFWAGEGAVTAQKLGFVYSSRFMVDELDLASLYWNIVYIPTNENEYSVILECFNISTFWNFDCELEATFRNGEEVKIVKAKEEFSSKRRELKVEVKFDNVTAEVSVDVRIKLTNVQGVRNIERFDLLKEVPELGDAVLVIDDQKLRVNKACVAQYSSFFKDLFFGKSSTRNQQEFRLENVDFDEFIDLANLITPEKKKITDESVKHILKLAKRFDMQTVISECEAFLIGSGCFMDDVEKLQLAEKYRLINVEAHIIRKSNAKLMKKLQKSELYSQLSDATKAALYENAFTKIKVNESDSEESDSEESDETEG